MLFNPYGVGPAAEGLVDRLEKNNGYCDAREEILIENTASMNSGPWMRLAKYGIFNSLDTTKLMTTVVAPPTVPQAVPSTTISPDLLRVSDKYAKRLIHE